MIKCVIVDDEPRNNEVLQNLLETYCGGVTIAGTALSVEDATVLIKRTNPDLVFLDIEMPGQNAFDLLENIRPVHFEVVFVTAFDKYAVRAFRTGAIDYLLKPVSIDELKDAVERVTNRLTTKSLNTRIEAYLDSINNKNAIQRIAIATKDGLIFFELANIVTCFAEGSYTIFKFLDGTKVTSSSSLGYFEEILPADIFFRPHHSIIINLAHVKSYYKGRGGYVTMANGEKVDISQRKKEEFLSLFKRF